MPTGPESQKRPADVIGNAVRIARIATGEETEDAPIDDGKDPCREGAGRQGRRRTGKGYEAGAAGGDRKESR